MSGSYKEKFDLSGKVAIVTGASKGIGEGTARALAEFGAKVVVSSRKQEAVDEVAASIGEAGGEAIGVACHVGDLEQLDQLVARTMEAFGGVDILVNNAAANPAFGPSLNTDVPAFDKIINVNLRAPFELSKRVFESMSERGGGSIVNISSIGGLSPEPGLGIYSVSKAALISLSKVLATEWGAAKVRVNAVCPGLVKTKFSAALWQSDEILKRFTEHLPLGYMAEPEEIVPLILFLASPASGYCTGGVYTVDAGHTI